MFQRDSLISNHAIFSYLIQCANFSSDNSACCVLNIPWQLSRGRISLTGILVLSQISTTQKNRMTIQTQNNRTTQDEYSEKIGPKK